MDDREYLEDDFDPKSLKVSQLRGVLSENDVEYPSNAKKTELLAIFNEEIKPKAAQLLKEYRNAVENANDDDIDRVETRKIKGLTSESESDASTSLIKVKKTRKITRKTRSKSPDVSTRITSFSVSEDDDSVAEVENPFTNDNVFQSNSSTPRKRHISEEKPKKVKKLKHETPVKSELAEDLESKRTPKVTPKEPKTKSSKLTPKEGKVTKTTPLKEAKVTKTTPSKEKKATPKTTPKTTPKNKSTEDSETDTTVSKTPHTEERKSVKGTTKSSKATPKKEKRSTKSTPKSANVSLEEELASFDDELKRIKKMEKVEDDTEGEVEFPVMDKALAAQLGITIQGFNEPKIEARKPKAKKESKKAKKTTEQPEKEEVVEKQAETEDKEAEAINLHEEEEVVKPSKSILLTLLKAFFFISLWAVLFSGLLFGYWYREQQYLVGYCGHQINQVTIPKSEDMPDVLVQLGQYLDQNFKPECTKCPAHARCFENLEIGCYEDFIEYKPWYFDYLPIIDPKQKICIPDTKKAEKIEIMIDVALDLLRSKNADRNCGASPLDQFDAGLKVSDLHKLLLSMKAPYITTDEFEELWARSILELEKEPEIITGYGLDNVRTPSADDESGQEENKDKILRSTSLRNVSLRCQLSNSIVGSFQQYKRGILLGLLVTIVTIFFRVKYVQYLKETAKVDTLYYEVLKKLQKQSKLSRESTEIPRYIGLIQLRDLILSKEKNLRRKLELWQKVTHKVEHNSNVRFRSTESYGEIMRVWEWVSEFN